MTGRDRRSGTGRGRRRARTAEAELVRVRLRGQRERQQRAPVERAFEGDHAGAAGGEARELDRVLDGLRARVEERGFRGAGERRPREQPLGQRCVDLVRDNGEVGVGEALELLLCGGDDMRMGMADVEAADAAREVDEDVAVDVGEQRAARVGRDDGEGDGERRRDARGEPRQDLARPRSRDLRPQLDRARGRHGSERSARPGGCISA